jgi:hypothetical protein
MLWMVTVPKDSTRPTITTTANSSTRPVQRLAIPSPMAPVAGLSDSPSMTAVPMTATARIRRTIVRDTEELRSASSAAPVYRTSCSASISRPLLSADIR